MRNACLLPLIVVWTWSVPVVAVAQTQSPSELVVRSFLKQHCIACHGAKKQESELRLDTLDSPSATGSATETWSRILTVIDSGEMPPEGRPRPTAEQISQTVRHIGQVLATAAGPRPVALRRLNRREYENTVHDLLGIETPLLDLLPEDGSVQGFDNVGNGLSISSVLMEQYLEAANVAFDSVIRRIKPLPAETRRAELMKIQTNIDSVAGKKGGTISVANSFVKFTPGWPPARIDDAHPIEDGIYRCRVAVWPHDPAIARWSVGSICRPPVRHWHARVHRQL